MLPPVDKTVLLANPQFEVLYNSLCLSKLDPAGTSKYDEKSSADYRIFEQELVQARLKAARRDLLVYYLATVSSDEAEVLPDVQEAATIVAAMLNGDIGVEDMSIVYESIQSFKGYLPDISAFVNAQLQHDADTLTRLLATPSANDLSKSLDLLKQYKDDLQHSQASLAKQQVLASELSVQLHSDQRKIIESCIRVLEQTINGSESRAVKAKVDYLATVAEGMAKKTGVQQIQLLAHLDTPSAQSRLRKALLAMKNEDQTLWKQCSDAEQRVASLQGSNRSDSREQELLSMIEEMHKLEAEISLLKA